MNTGSERLRSCSRNPWESALPAAAAAAAAAAAIYLADLLPTGLIAQLVRAYG